MTAWIPFPYDSAAYVHDAASLRELWPRLHAGDVEPEPVDPDVLSAWALFHAGRFGDAVQAGLAAGGAGITAANKAQAVYASRLERSEKTRRALFMAVVERADRQIADEPSNPNAHYWMAYALARANHGMRVASALAQGRVNKVRLALETTLALQPRHADAHVALGTFHAEVIDKAGSLLGRTQGASKDAGVSLFRTALKLNPTSATALIECANGLVMLEGDPRLDEASRLYERAAACTPADAMERLDVETARAELANGNNPTI